MVRKGISNQIFLSMLVETNIIQDRDRGCILLFKNNTTLTLTTPRRTNFIDKLCVMKMHFLLIEPNAAPANVKGHNTSSTSILVGWAKVPVADENGIILSYTVKYTALPGGIPRAVVVSAPTTHVILRRLEEYTKYSILVFASTVKGEGNASDPIIVTTDEDSKLLKEDLG